MTRYFLPFILLLISLISCNEKNDLLKEAFLNPPDSARPGVYWYFMDGNLNREEMTADLESMKESGIGYVLFLEVNVGVKRGPVDFLSEEWQDLFVHGVRECERLGIKLILGSGPGWAGSGGPWVKPEQSMMHLVASETLVNGPGTKKIKLDLPKPRTPIFGDGSLPPELHTIRNAWYEDVVVLAYPTPQEKFVLEDADEKAIVYRQPYTSVVGVKPYLLSRASYPEHAGAAYSPDQIIDLSDKLLPDGSLDWEVPPGKWTILRMGKRNNGGVTRPAPQPGLGFECDKFDAAAMDAHYGEYVGKLLEKVGPRDSSKGGGWTMIHIDSWEMGAQNWTHDFREQFTARRGYDPLPFLPALVGQLVANTEVTERFLWDVRLTGMELVLENHAGRFKELGRENGMPLSIEPYDMNPTADLDLGAVADVPMCEFWTDGLGFNSSFSCLESTSIGHVLGKNVIAAEAFTAMPQEGFQMYPGNMKNQSDWAFAVGINRFVYHTFVHKALGEEFRPGMTMGPYGVHWDRGQTWWPLVKDYHQYVSRSQFLLSQGRPVANILYLAAEGAPHVFRPPTSALSGTDFLPDKKAYSFDGCSPLMLMELASVKDHRIVFPGGASYELLILPDVETMTPDLLNKIEFLVQQGARIIGNPPLKSPSLVNYPSCDQVITDQVKQIWKTTQIPETRQTISYGEGTIFWGGALDPKDSVELYPAYQATSELLQELGIQADFQAPESIRYHHRSLPGREIYFLSNKTDQKISEKCTFRSGAAYAEQWDAITGKTKALGRINLEGGSATINLEFEPHGSCFIVFYPEKEKPKTEPAELPETKELLTLNGAWTVHFDPKWGGPETTSFETLSDWTENPEDGIKYYSGKAIYTKTFDLPDGIKIDKKSPVYLNLGTVHNMAQIKLNGSDLGTLWTYPWQKDISQVLKEKENQLEITIINRWINRLIGDQFLPDSARYTYTTYNIYTKESKLVPSGLVGPVRILK